MLVSLVILSLASAEQIEQMEVRLPRQLHVFLADREVQAVRARPEVLPWAAAVRDAVIAQADALVAEDLDIPHAEGQWTHWYSCADDGGPLEALSPTEHVCTVCGKVYSGWPYDQVYVTGRHNHWLSGVETLGVAYLLSERPVYTARARAILLEYASFYEDLKLHDRNGGLRSSKARLFSQTLDEAVAACRVCLGYDLVRNAECFTKQDRRRIQRHFLRPLAETIAKNDAGISNWQSWHNAALGCIGLICRDKGLVNRAVKGRSGFLFQMSRSVMSSGMWYEESPAYHWYALCAHIYLMEAASRAGMDLYALPIVKKMFDAPLRQVMPDLTFPALHDSDRKSIRAARSYYEVGYRRFQDASYLPVMTPRDSTWSLLWGVGKLPAGEGGTEFSTTAIGPAQRSSNSEMEGLAILRQPEGDATLYLDYGPGLSGHNQPAKLGIILYAFGDERLVDPGRLPYGNPLHKAWYRQTVAHNSIVVNAASQRRTGGTLSAFGANDRFSIIRAHCDSAYPDVVLDRTILLYGRVILDVVQATSRLESTFDLPLHFRADLSGLPEGEPVKPLGSEDGYPLVESPRFVTTSPCTFSAACGEGRRIHITCLEKSRFYQGQGRGPDPQKSLPMVLRRVKGNSAVFVTAYQCLRNGEDPVPVKWTDKWVTFESAGASPVSVGLFAGRTTCVNESREGRTTVLQATLGGLREGPE